MDCPSFCVKAIKSKRETKVVESISVTLRSEVTWRGDELWWDAAIPPATMLHVVLYKYAFCPIQITTFEDDPTVYIISFISVNPGACDTVDVYVWACLHKNIDKYHNVPRMNMDKWWRRRLS